MLSAGERVGDYVIEAEIGGGGMATVFRARHAFLETVHALKVLAPQYRVQPEARARFLDEAKIQARHLDHPNIVKVTGIVATPEHAALVMELVEGPSLDGWIAARTTAPSPTEMRALMLGVLDAVGHAHDKGVIHRDIKPANILLAPGPTPKVTDFGIAKVQADGPGSGISKKKSTHADARMGTLSYMSPEQIRRAKEVTARSDVFSLGAVLYELATGRPAFDGDSDFDVMDKIVKGNYPPPLGVEAGLARVIARALAPDPAARFASCREMAAALRDSGPPMPMPRPSPVPVPVPEPEPAPAAPKSRSLGWLYLAAPLVLAIGLYVVLKLVGGGGSSKGARLAPLASDPVSGPAAAPVTLTLFTSIDCATCGDVEAMVERVVGEFDDSVRLVTKLAPPASADALLDEAALAAAEQGRYFEMRARLRALSRADRNAVVVAAARLSGAFDMARFGVALDDHRFRAPLQQNRVLGDKLKTTLPGLFVGDEAVAPDEATLRVALGRALGDKRPGVSSGGAAAGPVGVLQSPAPAQPTMSPSPLVRPPRAGQPPRTNVAIEVGLSPTIGPDDAPVTIIEFTDFQCPFCARAEPTVWALMQAHPGQIRLVFKHNPLSFHPEAMPAAQAAAAAAMQGKFWEYQGKLWEDQRALGAPRYEAIASAVGLDLAQWRRDRNETEALIRADQAAAQLAGASGTPTFFVNGTELRGAQPLAAFESAFQEALGRAQILQARGITDHLYERLVGLR